MTTDSAERQAIGGEPIMPEQAWEILEASGLPMGALRRTDRVPESRAIREALRSLLDGPEPEGPRSEALCGFLSAWQSHWPQEFRAHCEPYGTALLERLASSAVDRGRYLKLRRIAIANLARVL